MLLLGLSSKVLYYDHDFTSSSGDQQDIDLFFIFVF